MSIEWYCNKYCLWKMVDLHRSKQLEPGMSMQMVLRTRALGLRTLLTVKCTHKGQRPKISSVHKVQTGSVASLRPCHLSLAGYMS